MPCNCRQSHCPECMEGWTPPDPPEVGSYLWKHDMAISYCIHKGYLGLRKNLIIKLPLIDGYDLGYMAIRYYSTGGYDYFRLDDITED